MVYHRKCYYVHLKRMYIFTALGWNALKISIKSIWCSVSFKATVSLLIFCPEDLSIDVNGVLKSPTFILLLLITLFYVHQDLFYIFRCSYVGCINVYQGYIHLLDWFFYYYFFTFLLVFLYYYIVSFVSYYSLCFKVYLVWYKYYTQTS